MAKTKTNVTKPRVNGTGSAKPVAKATLAAVEAHMTPRQWNMLAVLFDGANFSAGALEDGLAIKQFLASIVGTVEFAARLKASVEPSMEAKGK